MRVLIVGCGYVGLPLGAELVRQGHAVFGLRRSAAAGEALQAAGICPLVGDATRPESLASLPGPFDWVVNTMAASGGGEEDYRRTYYEGTRTLLEWLTPHPPARFVYASSTGVYAQDDGSLVKESSPAEPVSDTGRVLLETEKLLLAAAADWQFPAVILRVAGIYGPDRGHLFKQFLRNEARLSGNGSRLMNMIHQADVAGCIIAALQHGKPGEIYNAVDDEPVSQLHFFQWLASTLGKWMPPAAPVGESAPSRGGNKRVSNRKLKMELGYHFKYPTFREGYNAEISRLEAAGLLEIAPEER